jgi:hypothetical protein
LYLKLEKMTGPDLRVAVIDDEITDAAPGTSYAVT